jgi:hypothetical protein
MPELEKPVSPPPVLVTALEVRGISQPLAELGESNVSGLVLPPNQNQLRIGFVGLGRNTEDATHPSSTFFSKVSFMALLTAGPSTCAWSGIRTRASL